MEWKRKFFCIAALLAVALSLVAAAAFHDPATLFPELEGWSKDGALEQFQPDNLYEHINGAAENFLAYGFERLAVQNYVNKERQALTAEIYFHGTLENAFGIFSSEKPLAGDYLLIGSEGYAEEGTLNFISDAFYVKLNSFDLSPAQAGVLKALAEKIVAAIDGRNALPATLAAFPARNKVAHSERYILNNFLGHDFLGAAYTTDYMEQGNTFRLFIIKAASATDAGAMLRRWAALDKGRSAGEVQPGSLTINDPYNGPLRLSWRGTHIWGINGQTPGASEYLEAIAANLAAQ